MTFEECLLTCAGYPSLVQEFDRLSGTHLSTLDRRSVLDALIDEATGRDDDAVYRFAVFIHTTIWLPLIREQ